LPWLVALATNLAIKHWFISLAFILLGGGAIGASHFLGQVLRLLRPTL